MFDVRFILVNPSHPGNIGATARAMYVMGFSDLALVNPQITDVLSDKQAIQRASSAKQVLQQALVVDELSEALAGITHLCATAMIARDFGPATFTPREYFANLAREIKVNQPAANFKLGLLFGTERYGLLNDDVYKAHACLQIPTNPEYGSLNLAAAVQLIAYELRQAMANYQPGLVRNKASDEMLLADGRQINFMLESWQQALIRLEFLNPRAQRKLMPRLQQIINRNNLTAKEVNILHGIASAICRKIVDNKS